MLSLTTMILIASIVALYITLRCWMGDRAQEKEAIRYNTVRAGMYELMHKLEEEDNWVLADRCCQILSQTSPYKE